uniref:Nitrate transporter n=1 Tax=Solanum tuberosum TaxID=4113 RepID=M1DGE3_SOLTU
MGTEIRQEEEKPRKGVNESFEMIASYGLQTNMLIYLMTFYNMSAATATTILELWAALSNGLAIVGAIIANSYLGQFRAVAFGSISTLIEFTIPPLNLVENGQQAGVTYDLLPMDHRWGDTPSCWSVVWFWGSPFGALTYGGHPRGVDGPTGRRSPSEEAITKARMRRTIIRSLKSEYILFVTSIQGRAQQLSLEEFENLLSSQEFLAKQLASVFIKYGEGDALYSTRETSKENQEICHTLDPQMLQARLERRKNLLTILDVPIGDMVAAIEEIKEENLEHAISETTCASGDLYKESIERDVLEVKVYDQSSVISRSINDSEQIMKADGESRDQIEEEADIEVSETKV